jgi:hypothetical protein
LPRTSTSFVTTGLGRRSYVVPTTTVERRVSPVRTIRASNYLPTETIIAAPVTTLRSSNYLRGSRYVPTTLRRSSITSSRLALDPLTVSRMSTGRRSISVRGSRYIPGHSRRSSYGRGDGYWTTDAYGTDVWVSTYAPNRDYDVDSAVDRIIKKTVG